MTGVERLRRSNYLTQEQLAGALEVSQESISAWERGKAFPSTKSVLKLAKFFRVPVDEVLREGGLERSIDIKDG